MKLEFKDRNEDGFMHFVFVPTIELLAELTGVDFVIGEEEIKYKWEYSLGLTFLSFTIWVVW